jgi:hypothetical protein
LETLFDCLNEAEQTTLSDYLGRLITRLEQQQATTGPEADPRFGPEFRGRGLGNPFRRDGPPPADFRDFGRFFGGDRFRPPFEDKEPGPDAASEDKD